MAQPLCMKSLSHAEAGSACKVAVHGAVGDTDLRACKAAETKALAVEAPATKIAAADAASAKLKFSNLVKGNAVKFRQPTKTVKQDEYPAPGADVELRDMKIGALKKVKGLEQFFETRAELSYDEFFALRHADLDLTISRNELLTLDLCDLSLLGMRLSSQDRIFFSLMREAARVSQKK